MNQRRILITGGTGYVGTALVPKLARKYPVEVYCSMHFGNSIDWVPNVHFTQGDIRDWPRLRTALHGVTDVIHLAGIVTDELAALNPTEAKSINLEGMRNLLNCCVNAGVERFIYASSSGVYGTQTQTEVATEETEPKPQTVYMQTKLDGEKLLWDYKQHMLGVAVRSATCCGPAPRMRLDTIVNTFAKQAYFDGRITVWDGRQWRSNVHVQDIADLYIKLLDGPWDGHVFNATCENMQAKEIAERVQTIIPCRVEVDTTKVDDRHYRMSADKAKKLLGWVPKRTVTDAIADNRAFFEGGGITNPNDDVFYNTRRMSKIMQEART